MKLERVESLGQFICDGLSDLITEDYVLLDIPNHVNIGDQLIYKGELDFLGMLPHRCMTSSSASFNFKEDFEAGLILLHGGGNFGDLYSLHQNFRETIVKRYPEKKIIVFPQSVHFASEEAALKSAEVFNAHQNLTICARDQHSFDFLKRNFVNCSIVMLPDMAFCSSYQVSREPSKEILIMKRRDGELGSDDKLTSAEGYPEIDWPTFEDSTSETLYRYYQGFNSRISRGYYRFAKKNSVFGLMPLRNEDTYTQIGIDFLSDYKFVITTRLHGHILCLLLGIPSIMVNNSYGKNKRFYHTWLQEIPLSHYADTIGEALEMYPTLKNA